MRSTTYASRLARAALSLAAATLAACSAATGRSATAASVRAVPTSGHERVRDHLVPDEIRTAPAMSALDLVRTLRPEYLRAAAAPRPLGGAFAPVVYVDGNRWGGVDALGTIPASLVAEIRRIPAYEARLRYGLADQGPVIDVRLLRRR